MTRRQQTSPIKLTIECHRPTKHRTSKGINIRMTSKVCQLEAVRWSTLLLKPNKLAWWGLIKTIHELLLAKLRCYSPPSRHQIPPHPELPRAPVKRAAAMRECDAGKGTRGMGFEIMAFPPVPKQAHTEYWKHNRQRAGSSGAKISNRLTGRASLPVSLCGVENLG